MSLFWFVLDLSIAGAAFWISRRPLSIVTHYGTILAHVTIIVCILIAILHLLTWIVCGE